MYKKAKSKFIIGDIEIDWVTLNRGVRLGCVLSPFLFSIYTEELAARIGDSGFGVRVNSRRLGILVLIGFFEGYLICSINKRHSSLNIFKALRLR